MFMEKESARSQTLAQLHKRRKQVVSLFKQGVKIMEIVKMTGLSYPTVRRAIDLFEAGGWGAISRRYGVEPRVMVACSVRSKKTPSSA